MINKEKIQLFEGRKVRTAWDDEQEKWYFSVVDVVGVLTNQPDYQKARKYWNKLKQRLVEEGFQPVTNCHQLKLIAQDGKPRLTDVADTEQLFRIIQSIPSPKAEPLQRGEDPWLVLHVRRRKRTLAIQLYRILISWIKILIAFLLMGLRRSESRRRSL